jgi:regulator of protease activity HflC (stomatin/prohibitin superfamily)
MGPEFVGPRGKGRRFTLPRVPPRARPFLVLLLIVLVLPLFFLNSFFTYVHPNEYGVKEIKLGVDRGIQDRVYEAGYVFRLPAGFEIVHRFPRGVQVLELTGTPDPATPGDSHHFDRAAKIQTSDGYFVDVDVSILYRIVDPYRVITTLGPGLRYLENGVQPKAEPILKEAFGGLTTEDFYNSHLRVPRAQKARDMLNAELKDKGLEFEHVLVRYFRYSDEIQSNIEAKKLQDQLVFKNQAEARAATEQATLKKVTQEGEMAVQVELERGKAYQREKDAERELYVRSRRAEADLLVRLAEADTAEMKNEAMQALGADRKVAMEMAEVLRGLDTIVVPTGGAGGVNPLDLNYVLALFGVETGAATPIQPPMRAGQAPTANLEETVLPEEVVR